MPQNSMPISRSIQQALGALRGLHRSEKLEALSRLRVDLSASKHGISPSQRESLRHIIFLSLDSGDHLLQELALYVTMQCESIRLATLPVWESFSQTGNALSELLYSIAARGSDYNCQDSHVSGLSLSAFKQSPESVVRILHLYRYSSLSSPDWAPLIEEIKVIFTQWFEAWHSMHNVPELTDALLDAAELLATHSSAFRPDLVQFMVRAFEHTKGRSVSAVLVIAQCHEVPDAVTFLERARQSSNPDIRQNALVRERSP